ncbi:nitronate monooxygenase [Agromyces bauzanensis]|uniref:Propionate 3-nitronate monooxygenase n=2 Tax=Agromyces bauzanensis TaxID=1308924 RepID=A0A917UMW6_9MICO|nr:oxidoreductase [Agromyces bauzanensis]
MRDLGELLGIERPIVLGPFGGLSSIELTAAVSERGGLGSYGLYGYDPERIRQMASALRAVTDRPFALNLWLAHDEVEQVSSADFDRSAQALRPFFDELGLEVPERPDRYLPSFEAQFDAVLEARPAVVSFVFGVPSRAVVDAAHERGIVVVGTATSVDEAVALERGGVDAVVATGAEAGGHRVSFLRPAEESLVGTVALVPQVADAVTLPVIAAGGIADRRGVAAAFALGASGVQVGTAFLRTEQSATTDAHRRAITQAPAHGTVLTRAMSGRLARGIPNRAVRTIEGGGVVAPFPVQNWLTGRFRAEAVRRGVGELQSLWAGQAAALSRESDADAVFDELAAGLPA